MNKDELITKQQLEIEEYKQEKEENEKIKKSLHNKFFAIGAPLNDNILQFNKEQLIYLFGISELIEKIQ